MAEIHELILRYGVDQARDMARTKLQRAVVDAAAAIMAEEIEKLGISHAGFAMTSLPHKKIDGHVWRREGGSVTLVVQSGTDKFGRELGVPYGAIARMILIYLQTQAVQTGSREVELGPSMRSWMIRMKLEDTGNPGGNTYRLVNEQARRISACHLTFFGERDGAEFRRNGSFVDDEIRMLDTFGSGRQQTLWHETVTLNEAFYDSLKRHPVPLAEAALREIGSRSAALDTYLWLAYRLHSLSRPTPVSWPSLFAQFGAGYSGMKRFKERFREALAIAVAVYPTAKIEETSTGLILYPSPPPIAERRLAIGT